eukprot:CAMPEP_0172511608 /NCGR_PEP_ID=MMETSP1066-20121228/237693_1 /TAXON_ID=671091 /ORGANISM="Coscinodiscus wailesii, Strain CCMP2513" /LENGTH=314 /DNA_ID=CAMNT_0013291057 /DNA_START=54 /DNA_END=995 /DNA_ORIENTATION=-
MALSSDDTNNLATAAKEQKCPDEPHLVPICPELVHLSRFAKAYILHTDTTTTNNNSGVSLTTPSSLCQYNAKVVESWMGSCQLSQIWTKLGEYLFLLSQQQEDDPSLHTSSSSGTDADTENHIMQSIHSLLIETANSGDVQTCVAICEVMQILIPPPSSSSSSSANNNSNGKRRTKINGLEVTLVLEWYLSYIEILHQMCLFSIAAELIKNCHDPVISSLSQQSTMIYEACPYCSKPLPQTAPHHQAKITANDASQRKQYGRDTICSSGAARRVCQNCQRRIGLCFLCQETVKGLFVWCPGCGHGGHLECAIEW